MKESPCLDFPGGTCLHLACRAASSPIASRVLLNAEIRWNILDNWGRFLKASPKGSRRRKVLANIVRHIRRAGDLEDDYYTAVIWADALVPLEGETRPAVVLM